MMAGRPAAAAPLLWRAWEPNAAAENAAGYAKGLGELKFDLGDRHGSWGYFGWNQDGMALDLAQNRARFPLA